ncbi:hypothetical protein V5F44_11285 [Xanthobacter sp. V2C-8]|uniref:hypothetical protein n=1 Tax=Xanthobacter albus TaxID=3119929 RepID=UPI00372C47F9
MHDGTEAAAAAAATTASFHDYANCALAAGTACAAGHRTGRQHGSDIAMGTTTATAATVCTILRGIDAISGTAANGTPARAARATAHTARAGGSTAGSTRAARGRGPLPTLDRRSAVAALPSVAGAAAAAAATTATATARAAAATTAAVAWRALTAGTARTTRFDGNQDPRGRCERRGHRRQRESQGRHQGRGEQQSTPDGCPIGTGMPRGHEARANIKLPPSAQDISRHHDFPRAQSAATRRVLANAPHAPT